jgi:hypothetical protein
VSTEGLLVPPGVRVTKGTKWAPTGQKGAGLGPVSDPGVGALLQRAGLRAFAGHAQRNAELPRVRRQHPPGQRQVGHAGAAEEAAGGDSGEASAPAHAHAPKHTRAPKHARTRAHKNTQAHTTPTHAHTRAHAHIHVHMHPPTCRYRHTPTHRHTDTDTDTHAQTYL